MKAKDTPLKAVVEDGDLVIRIGVSRLAYCALSKNGGSLPNRVVVTDEILFAQDVARALNSDDETRDSKLNRLLDSVCTDAAYDGSAALRWPRCNTAHDPTAQTSEAI